MVQSTQAIRNDKAIFALERPDRIAELQQSVDEAGLEHLSPEDVGRRRQVLAGYLEGIETVRHAWDPIWIPSGESKVKQATSPNPRDNDQARDVKQRYAELHAQARDKRARAVQLVKMLEQFGPGPHQLSNGETVFISRGQNGEVTVTTGNPPLAGESVTFHENDPEKVSVRSYGPNGQSTLEMDGTSVRRTSHTWGPGGSWQRSSTESYSLDDQGRPVQELSSRTRSHWPEFNESEEYSKTTVNDDGSTDTRILVYRLPDGTPVFFDHHEDPRPCPVPWPLSPGGVPGEIPEPRSHPEVRRLRAARAD